jgi:hypothetical protein
MIRRLLILLSILFLVTPVYAVNFKLLDISTESDVVNPGKIFLTKLDIKNFDTRNAYVFVRFSVNDQVYEQGQILYLPSLVEIFPAFYVPAPFEPGFFKLNVTIYDNETMSSVAKTMIVKPVAYDFAVNLYPIKNGTFAGENTSFALEIGNIGNYNDVYLIELFGWNKFEIEQYRVSLYANSRKTININLFVPPETKKGIYEISTKVCSVTTQICKIVSSNLSVITSEKEQSLVRMEMSTAIVKINEEALLSFRIRNKGISNKIYFINVSPVLKENETWEGTITIESNNFLLEPNMEKITNVRIKPSKIGNYSFSYAVFSNGVSISDGNFSIESLETLPIGYAIANAFKPSLSSLLIVIVLIVIVLFYLRWRGIIFKPGKEEIIEELEPIEEKETEKRIEFPQEK